MSYCHRNSDANKRNLIRAESLPTVMNVCFTYCSLMWQELLLRSFSTVAIPSARSFYATGTGRSQGAAAAARDQCLGCELAARPNSSRVTSSMPFSLSSVLCNFSSFIFSLLSPSSRLPFLSLNPSTTDTLQEKPQQNEKDEACPRLPSSPPPAEAADHSLWEDDSS